MPLSPPRKKKSRPLPEPFATSIDDLAHDGRGVAHRDGKTMFIAGALPGEEVICRYTARHSKYDEGEAETVLTASPERVKPQCAHFGLCGGCGLQHLQAERQLIHKQDWLLDNLSRISKLRPQKILEPLIGPHWGYRRKARLGVKFVTKKNRVLVGFRERNAPYLADLNRCEVLHPRVGGLLVPLGQLVENLSIAKRVPQIEVAVGDNAVALSFRVLDSPTDTDKSQLIAFGQQHELQIYLQPGGNHTTTLLWPEQGELLYRLPNHDLELAFLPYHFIQINADINRSLVDKAISLLALKSTDRVLDLFCGLGNFTLALARHSLETVGIEGDKDLVAWAERNAARNRIDNARFFAADLSQDLNDAPWLQQPYDKILLDPPRLGAAALIPQLAKLGAQRIAYVSCHPATLARDASELVHRFGYRLTSAGVMDMFPHTAHVESIALFER